jgi:hypothetical protein
MRKWNFIEYSWHVLFFAMYPILNLLAHNITEVDISVAYRSLWISLAASISLLLLLNLFLRDPQRAGILASVFIILFYLYGHVHAYFQKIEIEGMLVGRHRVLAGLWIGLWALAFFGTKKVRVKAITPTLNLIAIVLFTFPAFSLGSHLLSTWRNEQEQGKRLTALESPEGLHASPGSPDVYFIILDQYTSSDVLAEFFDLDNSVFLAELEDMGFYVAACANSNYPHTSLSLMGTLNYDYVSDLGDEFSPRAKDREPAWQMIKSSRVKRDFETLGYQTISFESGYDWAEMESADFFYTLSSSKINNFEALLLQNSATYLPMALGYFQEFRLDDNERKRELIFFVLDQLKEVPSLPGKKFVFAHLVIPHPPFVFGPDGDLLVIEPFREGDEVGYRRKDFREGYRNQAIFINSVITGVLRQIIEESPQPPVIILQGDHGPITIDDNARTKILSAYLFPEPKPSLSPELTPVNNFRMIFRTYFNARSLPNLADKSYFFREGSLYDFYEKMNMCTPAEN